MRATRFLWEAAGRPWPTETDGTPLKATPMLTTSGRCAACGERPLFLMCQAISDSFTTLRNDGRAWPYGGYDICEACTWACRTLALRCQPFFAHRREFWILRSRPNMPGERGGLLTGLLQPPTPPFVACYPRFGIEHGGEENADRTLLSYDGIDRELWAELRALATPAIEELERSAPAHVKPIHVKREAALGVVTLKPPWPSNVDWIRLERAFHPYRYEAWFRACVWPLTRLQSKHCALYARIATSSEVYPLQIDDTGDIMVDVALWKRLRPMAEELLGDLIQAHVRRRDALAALEHLAPPSTLWDTRLLAQWTRRVDPFRPHAHALWWSTFVRLLAPYEPVEEPCPSPTPSCSTQLSLLPT